MLRKKIIEGVVLAFVILFLYTGISKIMDFAVFKEQIATSPLLAPVSRFIAIALPVVEFLAVLFLVVPRWRLKGLYASTALMVLFTVYIVGILLFNKEVPCSCGGALESLNWGQHIFFNAVFIVLGVAGIMLEKRFKHEDKSRLSLILQ